MSREDKLERQSDALAYLSGAFEALAEDHDEITTERLVSTFNQGLDWADVESEIIQVDPDE
jgi:hypothetical protein